MNPQSRLSDQTPFPPRIRTHFLQRLRRYLLKIRPIFPHFGQFLDSSDSLNDKISSILDLGRQSTTIKIKYSKYTFISSVMHLPDHASHLYSLAKKSAFPEIELANNVFNIAKDLYNKELHMVIFAIINFRFMTGHKHSIVNLHLHE